MQQPAARGETARSERPAGYARSCPARWRVRVQGDCRRERAPRRGARQRRRHQALERESPQGAQPTGIPAGAEGTCSLARNGRGRCGERPHARTGRSRAKRGATVGSAAVRTANAVSREQAEGGSGARGGPSRTHLSDWLHRSAQLRSSWWTQKGRGRLDHREAPSPELAARSESLGANEGQRDAVSCGRGTSSGRGRSRDVERPRAVAGHRAAEGVRVPSPALGVRHRYSETGYSSRR